MSRYDIGSKRKKLLAADPGGIASVPTTESERQARVLSDSDAAAIAHLARRVERDLGYAVDIEWALSNGTPMLLQARPLTALRD